MPNMEKTKVQNKAQPKDFVQNEKSENNGGGSEQNNSIRNIENHNSGS